MGQLRAKACPVCLGANDGKWTCPSCTKTVNVHRELIRNLQAWHSMYEAMEIADILVAADGQSYCLWDVDLFYDQRVRLPQQQRRAMELCLFENIAEKQAAVQMGVTERSPVAIYATVGLTRLLGWALQGELAGYEVRVQGSAA